MSFTEIDGRKYNSDVRGFPPVHAEAVTGRTYKMELPPMDDLNQMLTQAVCGTCPLNQTLGDPLAKFTTAICTGYDRNRETGMVEATLTLSIATNVGKPEFTGEDIQRKAFCRFNPVTMIAPK